MSTRVKSRSHGISLTTATICIVFFVFAALVATKLYDLQLQRDRLTAESESLAMQEQALKDELHNIEANRNLLDDSAYVENVARQQLDMVYPGEVIFRVNGK